MRTRNGEEEQKDEVEKNLDRYKCLLTEHLWGQRVTEEQGCHIVRSVNCQKVN